MSETTAEIEPASDAAEDAGARVASARTCSAGSGRCSWGIFLLDAGVLFLTSCVAWLSQGGIDASGSKPPYPYHWMPLMGPG